MSDFSKCSLHIKKSINDSEKNSNEEIVSEWNFKRKMINKISSSSSSDDEKSYASEDLDEMLEEFAINEEKELTTADDSLYSGIQDNIQCNIISLEKMGFYWICHLT